MRVSNPAGARRYFDDLSMPGRSNFDWAILCAAVALAVPVIGLMGVFFSDRSRRKGYGRWKSAMAASIWCVLIGIVLRGFLRMGVLP